MGRPGMVRGRGRRAVGVAAIGAVVVIAVAVMVSVRAVPGGRPASPAGRSRASRAPAGTAGVPLLVASHASPAATPVAMALDGTLAAGTGAASLKDGGTIVWNTLTGKVAAILPAPAGGGGTGPMAFSPGGATLAEVGPNGTVDLWDIAARKVTATLATPVRACCSALAFSPDGTTLTTADGQQGGTYLWQIAR
jgi:hypothetical protein